MPLGGPGGPCGPGDCGVSQCGYACGCGDSCGGGCGSGCGSGGMGGAAYGAGTSQIAFLGEEGIQVNWDVSGDGQFDSMALVTPGRQDFPQASIYRLRLSNIPGREGVELFPTLEVAPVTPRTDAFLAHSPIPVQFTQEDFDQVLSGNFVTKVIYLPDPEFQEVALAGVETLVSTRLDPGVDPIAEADRRGSILAIVRMGNKDLRSSTGMANYRSANGAPGGVMRASYEGEMGYEGCGPMDGCMDGGYSDSGYCGDGGYGGGYDSGSDQLPVGMPTSGFAPAAVPPQMIGGGPTWGMPITGTPIGLPGPPHVPLGHGAGLQSHVMKNRTRVVIPPAVTQMKMSVKQRPGMNYPRPVDHVTVDEVHREPGGLLPNFYGLFHGGAHGGDPNCDPNCQ